MAFTVGQKVVCVDVYQPHIENFPLTKNAVYTIRGICYDYDGVEHLQLHEAVDNRYKDVGYQARRFRPVVERKTEISFTIGADPESEKWDNRKPVPAYSFDVTEHESILQYLRGFY